MFKNALLTSSILFSFLGAAPAQADDLDPVGQIAYCQKEQRDAFAYRYDLSKVVLNGDNVEVDLLVYNFVCSKERQNGETVFYWKLVKDKTWVVAATVGSLYRKEIRYKETETKNVYNAHAVIPVKEFLSVIDLQTLRDTGAVDVERGAFFKHHNNFGWVALGGYRLTLGLHLRKNTASTLEVLNFVR